MITRKKPLLALMSALACALVLTSCGGSAKDAKASGTPTPTPSVTADVPSGVELTELGSRLEFGDKATVAYEANKSRSTVLDLTVVKVQRASIQELDSYVLDAATGKSTPYYVTVRVRNVGTGDLGRSDVPIFLVDSTDTLIHSSSFTDTFEPCASKPLPASFAPQDRTTTCQLFLVPESAAYREISFRPVQQVEPIVWEGDATRSKALLKKAQKKAQEQAQKSKKKARN